MYKFRRALGQGVLYTILILFALIFILPLLNTFILSTHDQTTIFEYPPPVLPSNALVRNFQTLFEYIPFFINFINSTVIAVFAVTTRIIFCTMTAFALAKYKFKGKSIAFAIILSLVMIPKFFNIIPMFKLMVWLKWVNTYLPLIIPQMTDAFGVFLMTQFLSSMVPNELMDAARMDGLSEYKMLFQIAFPLAKPAIFVLGTVSFIGSWNDFQWALIILTTKNMFTIPVALSRIAHDFEIGFGVIMVGTALSTLPIIIMFLIFSKSILKNFLIGSVKG